MKKYFHELSEDEFKELVKSKITYKQLEIDYPQPIWCDYPNATRGEMGCWGLVYFRVHNDGESYCKNCECNKLNKGEL
jgi:hypothetical protein